MIRGCQNGCAFSCGIDADNFLGLWADEIQYKTLMSSPSPPRVVDGPRLSNNGEADYDITPMVRPLKEQVESLLASRQCNVLIRQPEAW
jgi:hypothetical protein